MAYLWDVCEAGSDEVGEGGDGLEWGGRHRT